MTTTTLLDCGHQSTPDGLAAGYATRMDGSTVCYPCADGEQADEIAAARIGDRFYAYVGENGTTITSWSGGVLMHQVRLGAVHPWTRHSAYGERCYLTAVDVDGRVWSGVGAPGQYATLRLTKRTT